MWNDLIAKLAKTAFNKAQTTDDKKEIVDQLKESGIDASLFDIDDMSALNMSSMKNIDDSIFSQVSFDTASSLEYFVEEGEDNQTEVKTNKDESEMTEEETGIVDILKNLFNNDKIAEKVDINGDNKISNDEVQGFLKEVSAYDKNGEDLSTEDFEKLFDKLGIELSDLIPADTETEGSIEDITDPAELERAEKGSPKTSSASPAGSASPSGGATGSNGAANGASNGTSGTSEGERTPEEIQKEITEKETDKTEVKETADKDIQAEEEKYDKAVEEAMEEEKIDEEIQKEYEDKETELSETIAEQEKAIEEQEGIIQDQTATITAKETAITSVDGQISSLESELSSIQDTGDAEKDSANATRRTEINGKIENLKTEKENLETDKKTAEDALKDAQDAKTEAEKARDNAQEEKDNLLQTFNEKYPEAGFDKVAEKTKELKAETDKNIEKIKGDRDTKVEGLNTDIQALKTELAEAKQKEETDKVLAENSTGPDFGFDENLTDSQKADLAKFKDIYEANKDKYEEVAKETGVPAELIAAIHWRESSGNFETYLHNGDPLGKPTTHVPAGKNFSDWTEAAIDAINSQNLGSLANNPNDVDAIADYAERYNGLGYRKRGVASPYVWSGTTNYTGGKYVADGVYDGSVKDKQLGVMVMIKEIWDS